ncbi:MAG: hypothetical protein D6753_11370 [Planctomycetota bacterium]|nr:MAG: hypothetical protein D6753_11370 [Planctomycetota bacterium]
MARMDETFDDETLVAYLDRDLPEAEMRAVEASLRSDDSLRERLRKLEASWDLLLELPETAPDPDLAQSTIEMVALSMEDEQKSRRRTAMRRRLLGAVMLCLVLGAIGAVTGALITRMHRARLLRDLPALVEFRALQHIDSVEWLERLSQIEYLQRAAEYLRAAGEGASIPPIGQTPLPNDVGERWRWVQALDADSLARLHASRENFEQLPPPRRDELIEIAEYIAQSPRRDELLAAARAYAVILDAEGAKREQWIKDMDLDARQTEIEQIIARNLLVEYSAEMSPQDRNAVGEWMDRLLLRPDVPFSFDPYQLIIDELMQASESSFIRSEDIKELIEQLSPYPQELMRRLQSEYEQRAILMSWILSLTGSEDESPVISTEALMQKFQQLPQAMQDLYELFPEEETHSELERLLKGTRAGTSQES